MSTEKKLTPLQEILELVSGMVKKSKTQEELDIIAKIGRSTFKAIVYFIQWHNSNQPQGGK